MAKEEIKFTPTQHYKMEVNKKTKEKEYKLDEKGCKIKVDLYKGTTFEEMINFLKENGTIEQKEAFKTACHTKKVYEEVIGIRGGKSKRPTGETVFCEEVNVLYAKEWFFKEFAPEYLPKKEEAEKTKSMEDLLAEL